MDLFGQSGAEFSEDRRYRYALWRIWDPSKPSVTFIGLNPSRADESTDDPTIKRVKQFAFDWGFGSVYMLNLFAFIATDPQQLLSCPDPIGRNDDVIKRYASRGEEVVFAWGNHETHGRNLLMQEIFPNAKCLAKNMNGSPKHPLYVKRMTTLVEY